MQQAHAYHLCVQTQFGETAMMRASWWGHTDVVKKLMDKGADVNAVNWVSTQACMNLQSW